MKKLSLIIAAGCLALATPVFACPGHDSAETTKTAEKTPRRKSRRRTRRRRSPKATEAPKTAKGAEEGRAEDADQGFAEVSSVGSRR
jgi:hypothetical protein